jgi:hypothetical protein
MDSATSAYFFGLPAVLLPVPDYFLLLEVSAQDFYRLLGGLDSGYVVVLEVDDGLDAKAME